MKLGKLAEHYYTAAEARKMLEVDPETFQYWGRDGRIKRVYLPGRKQPVYPKPEINKMAQQTEAFTTVQAEKTDCKAPKNPIKEDKELSKQYYELEDVMRLLRKSRSTVIREANAGKIPTEGPKRNRRYPKEAIDALVEIEESKKRKKEQNVIFSPSTPNDLWQEVAIGRELYGDDDIVPFKTLLQWREINDEMFMSLKYKGNVVGYSSLMPLDEDIIHALIDDKIRERDIPLEAIRQWTDQNISVYVASVTVKPSGNPTRDSERAGIIIKNTIKWALALDRQTKIKNWYSIGATESGQDLLEALGFKEIVSLYNGERKGYSLDSIKKPVSVISRILDRLNQESEMSQSQA